MSNRRKKIAIIGSGISGIHTAFRAQENFETVLVEKDDRLGGHTSTFVIPSGPESGLAIDTGFIVFNEPNYPRFRKFLSDLRVDSDESDMSFSFFSESSDLEYCGSGLDGLFAQRKRLFDFAHWKMIYEIIRFKDLAEKFLSETSLHHLSIDELISHWGLSHRFKHAYLLPMACSIWSSDQKEILKFPAIQMIRFFKNHFLLEISNRPIWRFVKGGSHSYLKAFRAQFKGEIILGNAAQKIIRHPDQVEIQLKDGSQLEVDYVVIGAHADQTLNLLENPTEKEITQFQCWSYSDNHTILHTDERLMPPNKKVWSSWNYREIKDHSKSPQLILSYWMNRLQKLDSKTNYIVSLNCKPLIDDQKIVAEFFYTHPIYTSKSLASQTEIQKLQGLNRTFYCGAYLGNGFHEDGVKSSEAVLKCLSEMT